MSTRDELRRQEKKRQKREGGKKAPAAPVGMVSPLTSAPLDERTLERSIAKAPEGLHVTATKNEAAALNRTFLAVEGVLISISEVTQLLKERAAKLLGSDERVSLYELAKTAEAVGKASDSATRAMAMLMDMHRMHMRDPIRSKGQEATTTTNPTPGTTPGLPQSDQAKDFLAKLRGLPHPKTPSLPEAKPETVTPAKRLEPVPEPAQVNDVPAPQAPVPQVSPGGGIPVISGLPKAR